MSGSGVAPVFAAEGTLAASASTEWFALSSPFNILLWGNLSGGIAVERRAPDGTAVNCLMPDGTASSFSMAGAIAVPNVWERGAEYRLTRGAGAGTTNWRISL